MKTRAPTPEEIAELVSFLPRLHAEGFVPVKGWGGGKTGPDGVLTMPWPEYDEAVVEFFRIAGAECWSDFDYEDPAQALQQFVEDNGIAILNVAGARESKEPGIHDRVIEVIEAAIFGDGKGEGRIDQD